VVDLLQNDWSTWGGICRYRTIREFLKYLRIKRIVAKSQAKNEDIEKLSNEVKEKIWEESKDWFLQGIDK
jgi:hypothetical protein